MTTSGAARYTVADCIQPQNKLKILELSEIFGVSFRTVSFNDLHYPSWRDWRDGDPQSKRSTKSIYPGKARRSGRKTRHCGMTLCAEEDKTQRFRSFVCTFLFQLCTPDPYTWIDAMDRAVPELSDATMGTEPMLSNSDICTQCSWATATSVHSYYARALEGAASP